MGTKKKSQQIQPKPESPWIYAAILALALLVVSVSRLSYPELSHGDEWSDSSVMVAGENFKNLGFGASKGLPIFYPCIHRVPDAIRPDSPDWQQLDVFGTYTRLPAAFNWANGVLQIFFDYDNILPYKIKEISVI